MDQTVINLLWKEEFFSSVTLLQEQREGSYHRESQRDILAKFLQRNQGEGTHS